MDKFYKLTTEEWLCACNLLTPAELKVFFFLRTIDPWGESDIGMSVTDLAKAIGLNKSSVSRALRSLADKGWIELQLVEVIVRVNVKNIGLKDSVAPPQQCCTPTTVLPPRNSVAPTQRALHPRNERCAYATSVAPTQQPEPETLAESELQTSKTNKTKKDYLDSLSQSEREKFLAFCQKKAQELPKPPTLLSKWIDRNFADLLDAWEKTPEYRQICPGAARTQVDWQNHPKFKDWVCEAIETTCWGDHFSDPPTTAPKEFVDWFFFKKFDEDPIDFHALYSLWKGNVTST